MYWINLDDISGITLKTSYVDEGSVPGGLLVKREVFYQYPVAYGKERWYWMPVHADTVERDATRFEVSYLGNEN